MPAPTVLPRIASNGTSSIPTTVTLAPLPLMADATSIPMKLDPITTTFLPLASSSDPSADTIASASDTPRMRKMLPRSEPLTGILLGVEPVAITKFSYSSLSPFLSDTTAFSKSILSAS